MMRQFKRLIVFLTLLLVMLASTGCSQFEPWVKPYERNRLADSVMKFDPNPVSSSYKHHIYEVREAARGGLGASGGGCGCN